MVNRFPEYALGPYYGVRLLPGDLWQAEGPLRRSSELTPLYAERSTGPHNSPAKRQFMTVHTFWEMTVILGGQGYLLTEEHEYPFEAGTLLLIPPEVVHLEQSPIGVDLIWFGLRGLRVESLKETGIRTVKHEPLTETALALWLLASTQPGGSGTEIDALTALLFARFYQLLTEESPEQLQRIHRAINYLRTNFRDEVNIPRLAADCGYSPSYFYPLFKRITGKTPIYYLNELRIHEAQRLLLLSDLPIGTIAKLAGFAYSQYFSRVFKAHTGDTPAAFRQYTTRIHRGGEDLAPGKTNGEQ